MQKKIGGLLLRDELFGIHGLEPEEIFRESSPQKMVVPNNWAVKATKTHVYFPWNPGREKYGSL